MNETIIQSFNLGILDSDLVGQQTTYVTSQTDINSSNITEALVLEQSLIAYEPQAKVIQTLSLQSDLRSHFPDPAVKSARSPSLGPLPSDHPGA